MNGIRSAFLLSKRMLCTENIIRRNFNSVHVFVKWMCLILGNIANVERERDRERSLAPEHWEQNGQNR